MAKLTKAQQEAFDALRLRAALRWSDLPMPAGLPVTEWSTEYEGWGVNAHTMKVYKITRTRNATYVGWRSDGSRHMGNSGSRDTAPIFRTAEDAWIACRLAVQHELASRLLRIDTALDEQRAADHASLTLEKTP